MLPNVVDTGQVIEMSDDLAKGEKDITMEEDIQLLEEQGEVQVSRMVLTLKEL